MYDESENPARIFLIILVKIAAAALIITLLFTFLYGAARVSGFAMSPAVKDGDLVIFYRFAKNRQGDAVILKSGEIRRVAAGPGDVVDITESGLIINGALQQEPGIFTETARFTGGIDFPLTVPEGQVFVLADDRAHDDSRIYGCMANEDIKGKAMAVMRRRGI